MTSFREQRRGPREAAKGLGMHVCDGRYGSDHGSLSQGVPHVRSPQEVGPGRA